MSNSEGKHSVFVYGSFQEPDVVEVLFERSHDSVSALLSGFHRYRIKGRLHPCITPLDTGKVSGKVLLGLTDDELKNLDMIEGSLYERKTVEVVLTGSSEKLQVETYVWADKEDPNLYGEWDFEEWKQLHKEKFMEANKKFMEWKKNPQGNRIEAFEHLVKEDGGDAPTS
ncbi:PREDICTED: protein AIG2 A [Tarenaya hassleriana]|uniref:protein AIG2 A n=1 Tax=Tarenaya hassleriana TaxID=28532 RepID=UPI00053C8CB6|nr:PREDICTED: protein AIG2 A [Tarenaya hassleriana]